MSKTISFKHSGNTGDIIYALAGVKHLCDKYDWQADFLLRLDQKGTYYEGAKHPLGEYIFTDYMYKLLRPLLKSQPWVHKVRRYEGQKVIIDLDLIRQRDINMPFGHIARWYFYIFPDMACDLAQPWLTVPKDPVYADTIVVNRTQRYQNPHIHYSFLRNYKNVVFVGTQEEYLILAKQIPNMTFLQPKNFLQLAILINSCKIFIGNQSMCFALAEAMKSPRILEVCSFAPNVIPEGPGPAFDYYSQAAFEYYVESMTSKVSYGEAKVTDFDWSTSRFQIKSDGSYVCRPEDNDIAQNTLVDVPRLINIEKYVKQTEELPGVIAEVGVYKGGTALLIRKTSKKNLHLFDTFEGMPETIDGVDTGHKKGDFVASMASVIKLFENRMVIPVDVDVVLKPDQKVWFNHTTVGDTSFYKGTFPESLNSTNWGSPLDFKEEPKFSFVHLDVDIYQSVKDCLEYFYPRVVPGGIICVDDYNEPGCPGAKKAFDEFMADKPEGKGRDAWTQHSTTLTTPSENVFMDQYSQRAYIKL